MTEVVIEMAPVKTKTGVNPRYISARIPNGIINPVRASIEIIFVF